MGIVEDLFFYQLGVASHLRWWHLMTWSHVVATICHGIVLPFLFTSPYIESFLSCQRLSSQAHNHHGKIMTMTVARRLFLSVLAFGLRRLGTKIPQRDSAWRSFHGIDPWVWTMVIGWDTDTDTPALSTCNYRGFSRWNTMISIHSA